MTENLKKLNDTVDKLRNEARQCDDLHDDVENVLEREITEVIKTVPDSHRNQIEQTLKKDDPKKHSSVITASILRIELLFENDETCLRIQNKLNAEITDVNSAYQIMTGLIQNAAVEPGNCLKAFVSKFMRVLLILRRIFVRLDDLGILSLGTVSNLISLFLQDVFQKIIRPMIELKIINMFLPAFDDELRVDVISHTFNLAKLLTFTAGVSVAENFIFGSFGYGTILGLGAYCLCDKFRKDDEKDRISRARDQGIT